MHANQQSAEDANSQHSNSHSFTHKDFSENGKPTLFTCNEVVRIDLGMAGSRRGTHICQVTNDKVTGGIKNGVKKN
jgi:hypothetical protein